MSLCQWLMADMPGYSDNKALFARMGKSIKLYETVSDLLVDKFIFIIILLLSNIYDCYIF
ncbi:hypothetical protein [Clostridium butyricum]|uniref:hypothetical protein n=1 Tax=Clostridium butyricum TaxID=1492 RepID=UPI003D335743